MKKTILTLALLALAIGAGAQEKKPKAQNDTIAIKAPVQLTFKTETYRTSKGEEKTRHLAVFRGKRYLSNKTSAQRYATIKRFGGTPCAVIITTPSGAERITIL